MSFIAMLQPCAAATCADTGANSRADALRAQTGRRPFDVAISLAVLLLTMPTLLLVALLVKLDSAGPVFYRQTHLGLHGRPFAIVKFRSMRVDAEASGPQWAAERDPRVTRIGRALRLTRLDELPQLFNVLGGSMSLIGPRPERSCFAAQLTQAIPDFAARLAVKAGITGWAQVNYPYGASIEDARAKLTYDLFYLRHQSWRLNARILLATGRVICCRSGAR